MFYYFMKRIFSPVIIEMINQLFYEKKYQNSLKVAKQ